MIVKIFKLLPAYLLLLPFWVALLAAGCDKNEIPDESRKAEDYLGNYAGRIIRQRMAPDGFVTLENAVVETIPADVEITRSDKGDNFLMVYVSAYNDSILCEFDESTGYIIISDELYSFYMRTHDFPEFDGIYDHAVSTYGNLGTWMQTDTITFGIDFLKDMNDSIYVCTTKTKKIN